MQFFCKIRLIFYIPHYSVPMYMYLINVSKRIHYFADTEQAFV